MVKRRALKSKNKADAITHQGKAGSLIDRLIDDDEKHLPRGGSQEFGYIRSIQMNLENILNARVGTSAARPDYGLTDFNDSSSLSNDMLRFIRDDIKRVIEEFEPRLHNVRIEGGQADDGVPYLQLRVLCDVYTPEDHDKVAFNLALDNGHVKVAR